MVKKNEQLPPNGEMSRALGERVIKALTASPLFISAAIPRQIFPPLFNRYGVGHRFGVHVDNAVRGDPPTGLRIRTDLSVTLFLSEPDDYDGGELVVEDYYGAQRDQAARRPSGALSREQPAHRDADHPRRPRCVVLLAAKHDPRAIRRAA